MTRDQARQALEESLSRGSNTPCTGREDRDAYIAEKSDALRAALIDPEPVSIWGSAHDTGLLEKLSNSKPVAIAKNEQHWLLYLPDVHEFALAFGASSDRLSILGFSSDDALAEWLG